MSNDTLDVLRSFRGTVPEADDELAARVLCRVTEGSRSLSDRKRRSRLLRVSTATGFALAVAVVVLVAPWHHGPASVPAAEAARVLSGTLAVLTPRAGWVFHERVQTIEVVPGTTKKRVGLRETWVINGPPHRYRQIETNEGFTGTVETGGTAGTPAGYVYDGTTKTIYRSALSGRFAVAALPPPGSWRASISHDIRAKRARVVRRTVVDGRHAYEIEWLVSQSPYRLFVDATTYAPIEIEYPALGFIDNYWWAQSDRFVAYAYIRPSKKNLALANIVAAHPTAQIAPATDIPGALRTQLHPGFYVSSGR